MVSSTASKACSLWGMVTDNPASSRARIPVSAAAAAPARTGNATDTQSRPSASNAALCNSGDNECETGSPMTPTTRDAPLGQVGECLHDSPEIGTTPYPRPRLCARRSLPCWPAKVLEKASVPSLETTTKYSHEPGVGARAACSDALDGKQIGVGVSPVCR